MGAMSTMMPMRILPWLLMLGAVVWGGGRVADAQVGAPRDVVKASVVWSSAQARPGDQRVLAVVVDIADRFHINPDAAQAQGVAGWSPYPSSVTIGGEVTGLQIGQPQFPEPHALEVGYFDKPVMIYERRAVIYVPVIVEATAAPGERAISVAFEYQACDDKVCFPPRTLKLDATLQVTSLDAPIGEAADHGDLFAGFDPAGFAAMVRIEEPPAAAPAEASGSIVRYVLLALLGGLLLNFTPCVLPVIPIKVLSLANSAHHDRRRTLLLGVVMFAGVLAFWMTIAALIVGTTQFKAVNRLFQIPEFTIGVGVLIAVMAVGMCGMFSVRLPQWVYAINPRQDTLHGSFGFGVMTAILSTPCTAPVMGGAAGWATQQPAVVTLITFAAIGVGMGSPYLALAAFPRWVDRLPRTGPGSELLKQVMGIFMLAAAAYFIGTGINGLVSDGTRATSQAFWWAVFGFIAAGGAWLAVRAWLALRSKLGRAVFSTLGALVAVAAVAVGIPLGVTESGGEGGDDSRLIKWIYYTPEAFDAELAAGRVVVMDFTADWCINCKVLERSVLESQRVVELLEAPDVVPIKVDITSSANVAGNQMLAKMNRVTIPLLVVFSPDGREVFKADFYTIDQVVAAVERARGQRAAVAGWAGEATLDVALQDAARPRKGTLPPAVGD